MKKNTLLVFLLIISCLAHAQTPVQIHGALTVNGNKILNQHGQEISLAGPSLFWSNNFWGGEAFYTADVVDWVHQDWEAPIIRAAMGVDENGGYLSDTLNKEKVKTVVNAAISQGIYVIIDWHSHHAEDYQTEAIQFFQEMATDYGQYDNIIYEIYNEPLGTTSWSQTIKPYSEAVIAAIRAIDSNNLIIVGTQTWSQDVDIASNDPITTYTNLAYALHFYAGTHGQFLRNKALSALNNGVAIFASEWGAVNADGDGPVDSVETEAWMDFLCTHKISHCNWALNDKMEGASSLLPGASTTGNWSTSDLTASGILVRDIIKNWNTDCNPTLDIHDTHLSHIDLTAYPNPCTDILHLSSNTDISLSSIKVYNMLGQKIKEIPKPSNSLNLSELKPGYYSLLFITDRGISTQLIELR